MGTDASDAAERAQLDQILERAARALECLDEGEMEAARGELRDLLSEHALLGAEPLDTEAPEVAPIEVAEEAGGDPLSSTGWDTAPPPAPAEPLDFVEEVAASELDLAFDEAEADPSEMASPNHVAEQVLEETDPQDGFEAGAHPLFATATMAGVLEEQGQREAAQAIREALYMEAPSADEEEALVEAGALHEPWPEAGKRNDLDAQLSEQARTLATLERWLSNVRRDVA